ncbi:hypothetical protein FF38_04755 [Lucilia cuprina]|uniref:Uncharacterized protein n=1 Tax=Lucilia cuprina TaxID=7375 RepID=A0A0L0CTB5_LUCCU|nr:hypothetical protein FF38_04755 [Lucilia cuprina]
MVLSIVNELLLASSIRIHRHMSLANGITMAKVHIALALDQSARIVDRKFIGAVNRGSKDDKANEDKHVGKTNNDDKGVGLDHVIESAKPSRTSLIENSGHNPWSKDDNANKDKHVGKTNLQGEGSQKRSRKRGKKKLDIRKVPPNMPEEDIKTISATRLVHVIVSKGNSNQLRAGACHPINVLAFRRTWWSKAGNSKEDGAFEDLCLYKGLQ